MEYRDKDFNEQEILLDGNTFTGCTFRNCRITYLGEGGFKLEACHFKEGMRWYFDRSAAATLNFLAMAYHSMGEGGRELVEKTFEDIRRPR